MSCQCLRALAELRRLCTASQVALLSGQLLGSLSSDLLCGEIIHNVVESEVVLSFSS
jgi:hypothetical protein